jgi:hypothetical protein
MSLLTKAAAAAISVITMSTVLGGIPAAHADVVQSDGAVVPTDSFVDPTADDSALARSAPPASVDLTAYAMPVRNQGQINSCVPWAIDYGLMGWWSKRQGIPGAPFAPMFTYSQLVGGRNLGTAPADVLAMGKAQGVDTASHYTQGYFNYTTLPTASEKLNALHYRIRDYKRLFASPTAGVTTAGSIIKTQLAAGRPVAILLRERKGFLSLGDDPALDTDVTTTSAGNHEVLALGYNANGVLIQNSWGTNGTWNANNLTGYGRISWNVLNHDVFEADTISGLVNVADHSLDDDINNDIVARLGNGDLYYYPGNGAGAFGTPQQIGTGFNDYRDILVTKDVNGDNHNDFIGRDNWGSVWLLYGNGSGGWSGSKQITVTGVDFSSYQRLLAPGDFNGDGRADLLGVDAGGYLNLFPGNGAGGFGAPGTPIGHGWSGLTAIYTPGDFDGDKTPDLIARRSDGTLWLYPTDGLAGFHTPYQIGTGWGSLRVTAPGDLTGDGKSDLLAIFPSGALVIYPGNGTGKFSPSIVVTSSGWDVVTYLG